MVATGTRRGHLIYHWRHGWIPLDHFAALSKAHHSRTGAVKVMRQHGIEVPHGYLGAGHHGAPKVSHHAFDKKANEDLRAKHLEAVRSGDSATAAQHAATLRANAAERDAFRRQMDAKYAGQGRPFMRQQYGVDPAAMSNSDLAKYHASLQAEDDRAFVDTGRKLRELVSAEHASRTTAPRVGVMAQRSPLDAMPSVAPRDALMRGEHVPTAREIAVNTAAMKAREKQTQDVIKAAKGDALGKALLEHAKQGQGTSARGAMVRAAEDVGQGNHEQARKRLQTALDDARAMGPAYPGDTTNAADIRALRAALATFDGHVSKPAAPKAEARVTVEHSGDGTILHFAKDDMQAREAAKAVGARWSRNLGAWYLPRNQTESTRRMKVAQLQSKLGDSVHVVDAGHGKTSTAAEREAERKAASAARAERLDARAAKHLAERDARFKRADDISQRRPFGQPILVGHYSERGARADQRRIETNMDKGVEAGAKAAYTQRLADAARKNATGTESPLLRQRRIDRNEAEIRKIDREITAHKAALDRSGASYNTSYMDSLTARRAELADQVAHDKAQIEASGFKGVNPAEVKVGDMIQYRGRTHIVTKVNKTTFSVPTPYSWEDKVPINQATKHIPLSTQSDGALESAYKSAKNPKVKAAISRELNKRGLTPPTE